MKDAKKNTRTFTKQDYSSFMNDYKEHERLKEFKRKQVNECLEYEKSFFHSNCRATGNTKFVPLSVLKETTKRQLENSKRRKAV